jgi:hypothetical protein
VTLTAPVEFLAENHVWHVDPAFEAWVKDTLAPAAHAPEELPGAEVIKANRVRVVARIPTPAGVLFVKRFRPLSTLTSMKWAVKGTPAGREYRALRRLLSVGLTCPEAVILAEEHRHGLPVGAVLATREIPDCITVGDHLAALRARGDLGGRERLTRALAEAAWTIFRAGGDHPDMHLGNFLLTRNDDLVTLDLHSVNLLPKRLVPKPIRRRRLGKLVHSLGAAREPEGVEDARSFAQAYAGLDHALGPASRLEKELLARAERVEAVRRLSRDKRCVMNSSLYAAERVDGQQLYRLREVPTDGVLAGCTAEPIATVHAHPYGRTRVELIDAPGGMGEAPRVLRKTYRPTGAAGRLAGAGHVAALRAWKGARACRVREVPTPMVYAFARDGERAFVFMEHVDDARMLHHLARAEPRLGLRSRRLLAEALGALVGRLHNRGLSHGDLSGQNILARPRDRGWDLWLLDHEDVRVGGTTRADRISAFVQLGDMEGVTRTDCLRFFRAYLEGGGERVLAGDLTDLGVRDLGQRVAAGIAQRARERAERHANRDKPPRPPAVE